MSRITRSWVAAAITTIFAMMLSTLGSISAASAVPGDPIIPTAPSCVIELVSGDPATAPPVPTCYDPSGSDLDEFLVPNINDANGRHIGYENGAWSPYKWDSPNSTNGASQVFVQSTYYDPAVGMYVNGHAWNLTFNTSITATPAANGYWVVVGDCLPGSTSIRAATAYFRNEAGADSRYIGSVLPKAWSPKSVAVGTQAALRVLDGATIAVPLVSDVSQGSGLAAGYTYTVDYWLQDTNSLPDSGAGTRRIGGSVAIDVPTCNPFATVPPPAASAAPKAKIVVLKRGPVFSKVKVVLGSRKATEPTKYKVIRKPLRGKTLRKTFNTKFKVVKYYKIRKGTVIKVRFQTKVLRYPAEA